MRTLFLYGTALFFFSGSVACNKPVEEQVIIAPKYNKQDYAQFAQDALQYCYRKSLNTDFFILIDLSVHSGKNRFFIWDFSKNAFTHSYLVSHGCCNNPWGEDYNKTNAIVSNVPNSHCSSVGKYILGERGYSNWGVNKKYLMHGMESTNNNALARQIVFHSWDMVANNEIFPAGTPEGWGCPAVSNNAFRVIDSKVQGVSKRTLMWIIN